MPLYFFSHVSEQFEPRYMKPFFEDLEEAVFLLSELPREDVCFIDRRNITLGSEWFEGIASALKTCRVLLAMCTPRYWKRPFCSREWGFFDSRIDAAMPPGATERPPLLIPVTWTPSPPHAAPFAERLQRTRHARKKPVGSGYDSVGLLTIVKRREYEPKPYHDAVDEIASAIIEASQAHPLAAHDGSLAYDDLPDAFGVETGGGPGYAAIFHVVGAREEISTVKEKVGSYGGVGDVEWRPYDPPEKLSARELGNGVARPLGFTADFESCDERFVARVAKAKEDGKVTVVVIDPWTLELEKYRKIVEGYDAQPGMRSPIIVPWNTSDGETVQKSAKLNGTLWNVLGHQQVTNVHADAKTSTAFRTMLRQILIDQRRRAMVSDPVPRPATGPGAGPIPILNATKKAS